MAILDNPGPDVLRYGTRERLEEKLGWLRQFREGLKGWSEMEQTIDVAVDFVRTQGLYRGAGNDSAKAVAGAACVVRTASNWARIWRRSSPARRGQLRRGERLPGSSEVIESCFGKFKTLEREQARVDSRACSWHWPRALRSGLKRSFTRPSRAPKLLT